MKKPIIYTVNAQRKLAANESLRGAVSDDVVDAVIAQRGPPPPSPESRSYRLARPTRAWLLLALDHDGHVVVVDVAPSHASKAAQ